MTKRITAKIEEYQKDGETKGKYVELGVILSNENGEFILLDPSVSLSGILVKQNVLAANSNGKIRDNVMCSIFDNDQQSNNQGQNNQTQGYQQNNQQQQMQSQNNQSQYNQQVPQQHYDNSQTQQQNGYNNNGGFKSK